MIGPLHAVDRHLLRQADVGGVVLGDDEKATGVLVNAVDDAGADLAADAGKAALAVPQQRIDQCRPGCRGPGAPPCPWAC